MFCEKHYLYVIVYILMFEIIYPSLLVSQGTYNVFALWNSKTPGVRNQDLMHVEITIHCIFNMDTINLVRENQCCATVKAQGQKLRDLEF